MLDFRHQTFLALCKIGNYTKTAESLFITQPAVSQHIKFLEEHYKCKLFYYEGKTLTLTENGKLLHDFAMTMSADSQRLTTLLSLQNFMEQPINFGATLTIGEYVMPPILTELMRAYPNLHITMLVDNTQVLLRKLCDGIIDFAFLEGFFDKTEYIAKVFSEESFIPICSNKSHIAYQKIKFDEVLNQRLILREKGSGTRDVFEQLLCEYNLTIDSFDRVCEIGNMSAIKQLVADNFGITFLYRAAVEKELASGELCEMDIKDFKADRKFNFVFLKNSLHQEEYLRWFNFFRKARDNR